MLKTNKQKKNLKKQRHQWLQYKGREIPQIKFRQFIETTKTTPPRSLKYRGSLRIIYCYKIQSKMSSFHQKYKTCKKTVMTDLYSGKKTMETDSSGVQMLGLTDKCIKATNINMFKE